MQLKWVQALRWIVPGMVAGDGVEDARLRLVNKLELAEEILQQALSEGEL
jgi:hypothetical protein